MRISGNSVDQTTWIPNGTGGRPQQVAPSDVDALAAFLRIVRWKVIYGINLSRNTPTLAAAEAKYVANSLGPSLYGFEIGNEPDEYSSNGIRSTSYTLTDFTSEWYQYVTQIRLSVPNATITGPSASYNVSGWTVPFASAKASTLKLLTQHYYRGNGASPTSTMSLLLSPDRHLIDNLTQLHAAAESNNIEDGFRLSEANSFYRGGAPAVSNAYGSALWAIDFILASAKSGAAGVNLHGGGSGDYDPYYTPIDDVDSKVMQVMPVFYGMLFVNQICPGPMYQVQLKTTLDLSAYAVAGSDGATYVAIVNKDPTFTAATSIAFGASHLRATSIVLAGQGLAALSKITLGGSSFSKNGSWSPSFQPPVVFNGSLNVNVEPASAMLLKVT